MYQKNGLYYDESHSISFGDVVTQNSQKVFSTTANTWTDWHLIPSSNHSISLAAVDTKYMDVEGIDGSEDFTTYVNNDTQYSMKTGTLGFFIDHDQEDLELLRSKIASVIHGKWLKMRLMDDPDYYYEGFFEIESIEPGADYSKINIKYQLQPYKCLITNSNTKKL